jgi:signal transduction histidine kinase
LSYHGLAVALESLAGAAALPVQLDVDLSDRLPEPVEVAAYYVVSECLTNAGKHAQAGSASVRVSWVADLVVVEVADDGVGGADPAAGSGLRGLSDRVQALGGRLLVTSSPDGTVVTAEIPCQNPL